MNIPEILQVASFKVLLIGDSCIDEYKIGTIDRLSPEAPVPVIKLTKEHSLSGMSANVRENFKALGIDVDYKTNKNIITKTRYIDERSGQHLLRVDNEPTVDQWEGDSFYPLNEYKVIVISDYDKGFLDYEDIEHIIKSSNGSVFIDTKKKDLSRFSGPNVFVKINESEYKSSKSLPTNLIVTLGSKGAMLKTSDPLKETIINTKPVEVMDVCGCGDTFLAAVATQYVYTKNIESAIMFANIAAGITVQHRGNYAPTLEEIKRAGY